MRRRGTLLQVPHARNPDSFAAFLSYAQNDDLHDYDRITILRRRLEGEILMQTGGEFPIFQDRSDIFIGQQWWERIEQTINGSTLLIAVITPSFLKSQACRDEVRLFAQREISLKRIDLIVPILYVPTPGLEDSEDEIAKYLIDRQYFLWGERRFEDMDSNDVRRQVATLAEQVVEAVKRSKQAGRIEIVPDTAPSDDGLGFLELLAEAEDAMPLFTNTIVSLGKVVRGYRK